MTANVPVRGLSQRSRIIFWVAIYLALLGIISRQIYIRYQRGALFRAAGQGDLQRLQALLQQGADPNMVIHYESDTAGKMQDSPLLTAALRHQWGAMHLLLEAGANASFRDGGMSPLWFAIQEQNAGMVQELLRHHADPNITSISGNYLLCDTLGGDPAITRMMLEADANPNSHTSDGYLLIEAVLSRYGPGSVRQNFVRMLLAHGADLNARNLATAWGYREGGTPLMAAVTVGDLDVVRLFLARGASPNTQCQSHYSHQGVALTALRIARQAKRTDIMNALIKAGAKE